MGEDGLVGCQEASFVGVLEDLSKATVLRCQTTMRTV